MNVTIKAYKYKDLDDTAQLEVLGWLVNNGHYWLGRQDVIELCEANEYLFNKYGRPIHHLIIE